MTTATTWPTIFPDLAPDPLLPPETQLWARLQRAGGGTWGGCVYDVERISLLLELGQKVLERERETGPGSRPTSLATERID